MAAADWRTWLVGALQSTVPVDIEIDGVAMRAYVKTVSQAPKEVVPGNGIWREYVPGDDIDVELRLTFDDLPLAGADND